MFFISEASASGTTISVFDFERFLRAEQGDFTLAEWVEVVKFTSDQTARWTARWMFSPLESIDREAMREANRWVEVHRAGLGRLRNESPAAADLQARLDGLIALKYAINRRLEESAGHPIQRRAIAIVSRIGIWLSRVGLRRAGEHLYSLGLYPPGSVGRDPNRTWEIISDELCQIEERKQRIIDQGAREGKTVRLDGIQATLEKVKRDYAGPDAEEFAKTVDRCFAEFREKYGDEIPVDVAYTLIKEYERRGSF